MISYIFYFVIRIILWINEYMMFILFSKIWIFNILCSSCKKMIFARFFVCDAWDHLFVIPEWLFFTYLSYMYKQKWNGSKFHNISQRIGSREDENNHLDKFLQIRYQGIPFGMFWNLVCRLLSGWTENTERLKWIIAFVRMPVFRSIWTK